MALVKFVRGTAENFALLDSKNQDTLYIVTDEQRLYLGDKCISGGIYTSVSALPGTGAPNTLYLNTTDGSVSYWNGTGYTTLVKPSATAISNGSTHNQFATAKAVYDYVTSQISDLDVSALAGRVTTLEGEMDTVQGQIATINGEGEGSIKKAASDAQTAAIAAAKSYTDQEAAKKANLEHTHEIDDVTGLQGALDGKANTVHTHTTAQVDGLDTALAGKADKSTTLAGYGIGDAYTKGQTDSAIATAVAAAPHLKRSIVEDLPDAGEADQNTIYMVGTGAGSEDSAYEEYMVINGAFEKIGSSKVDLTNYAEKTYVDSAKQEAISTAAGDATQKANTAEQNAKTYADGLIGALDVEDTAESGKYVSAVAEVDGKIKVTRASLPAAATLVEGTANGTVKFNGTDVPVHGLKSAAYTDASAYDAAGTAAAAIAALDKTDAAVGGQYVSAVSQEDGIITVTRAALPTAPKITEGSTNGTISVGGEDVPVHGLGSAAYTESGAYATAAQGTKADSALQKADITSGSANGTIAVKGTDVAVKGLGSAAYTESTAYATAAQGTKADEVYAALTWGTI